VALGLSRRYYNAAKQKTSVGPSGYSARSPTAAHLNSPGDLSPFTPVFLSQLQDKFYSARNSWNSQVEKFRILFTQCQNMVYHPTKNDKQPDHDNIFLTKEIFDAILLLIIGDTVQDRQIAMENVLSIYEAFPLEMEFFVPQIALFLLYGAFELEEIFKKKLLLMCEQNMSFAYKLYWFIESFCLGSTSSSGPLLSRKNGGEAGNLDVFPYHPLSLTASVSRDEHYEQQSHRKLVRLDSESKEALLQFQEMIIQAGNSACQQFIQSIQSKNLYSSRENSNTNRYNSRENSNTNRYSSRENSNTTRVPVTQQFDKKEETKGHDEEQGLLKGEYKSYGSYSQAVDHIPSQAKTLLFPIHLTKLPTNGPSRFLPPLNPLQSLLPNLSGNLFDIQLSFWTALIAVTTELFDVSKQDRKAYLEEKLSEINEKYLPSSLIHIPLGNTRNRIWKIHVHECFSFATKERTPMMVCFEVLVYDQPKKKTISRKKWWSALTNFGLPFKKSVDSTSQDKKKQQSPLVVPEKKSNDSLISYYNSTANSSEHPSARIPKATVLLGEATEEKAGKDKKHLSDSDLEALSPTEFGQWSSPSVRLSQDNRRPASQKQQQPSKRSSLSTKNQGLKFMDVELGNDDENPARKLTFLSQSLDDRFDSIRSFPQADPIHSSSGIANGSPSRQQRQKLRHPHHHHTDRTNADSDNSLNSPGNSSTFDESMEMDHLSESEHSFDALNESARTSIHNSKRFDEDPLYNVTSKIIFKEKWKLKEERLRQTSSIGHFQGWKLIPIIIKSNDDLRQEQIASQIISFMSKLLDESKEKIPNKLKPYSIVAITSDSGLIEAIPNTVGIDVIKKQELGYGSLSNFFESYFEMENNPKKFTEAQEHFIISMANYSVVCYLLNIKDRHNGNILVTTHGSIVHIDFGFILGKLFIYFRFFSFSTHNFFVYFRQRKLLAVI
jgi:hypothetical protein